MNRREALRSLGLAASSLSLNRTGRLVARIGGHVDSHIDAHVNAHIGANDKLTIGCIGVGSQGLRVLLDMLRLPEVQVVAVCDVNRGSSDYLDWGPNELRNKVRMVLQDSSWGATLPGPSAGREVAQGIVNAFYAKERGRSNYNGCTAYEDFRELLAKEKDLDAVIVSTPDHWHGPIAIASMRAGKHVYSQKPMAHSVWECREMARVAKETGRATQVSIFNSNSQASQQVRELLSSGAIGPVRSIDIWTKRASRFWKQGLATPTQADPIPEGLNWDMWLGPAPMRPFSRSYLPFVWRAWYDFGCGALGDMGEYGLDTISRAVGLQAADGIEASSTDLFPECYPVASSVHFNFAKTASRPEVKLNWYDGGIEPRRPSELADDRAMGVNGEGVIYTGDSGKLMTAFMGENPCLLSRKGEMAAPCGMLEKLEKKEEPFQPARPELGASASSADAAHFLEWVRACQGGPPARANYGYEAPIVETLLLGCIAVRTHEVLTWDAENFRLTRGSDRAAALLKPQYRSPWGIS
jgi:predicted dehydrogenase